MPSFMRAYPPAQPAPGAAIWLPFQGNDLVVQRATKGVEPLQGEAAMLAPLNPGTPVYLGTLDGVPVLTCDLDVEATIPEGWRGLNLRALWGQLDEPGYGLAGYAAQMLYWQKSSGFCAKCGGTTAPMKGDWGKRCTVCGHTSYPHVNPAVLALVHDGDNILLTHKPGWGNRYSIIAGFVEPGESLEECVQREVLEEAGVELTDITYYGSQPWPFPHQVMIAFMGRYAGGEIKIDDQELDDAKWFHVDAMPDLPPALSISRQVINAWVNSRRPGSA